MLVSHFIHNYSLLLLIAPSVEMLQCCYFLRQGTEIDSSLANDTSLLYGEILSSPLETFKSLLSSTYAPLFAESAEWGSASEEQKSDFTDEMNKFMQNLSSAVDSLSSGLELRQISTKHIESFGTEDGVNPNPEAIAYFEELVGEWCTQIGDFIDSRENDVDTEQQSGKLEGPKCEVEYWRTRTQQLSSINDQLKRKECRYVIGILSAYTKGVITDQAKMKTIALLRKWKQIDIETTEAANEAKDNLKYLSTLQRFVEPLYSGSAQSIIDTLPALINSIKVGTHFYISVCFNVAYSDNLAHSFLFSVDDLYHFSILQHRRTSHQHACQDNGSNDYQMQGKH